MRGAITPRARGFRGPDTTSARNLPGPVTMPARDFQGSTRVLPRPPTSHFSARGGLTALADEGAHQNESNSSPQHTRAGRDTLSLPQHPVVIRHTPHIINPHRPTTFPQRSDPLYFPPFFVLRTHRIINTCFSIPAPPHPPGLALCGTYSTRVVNIKSDIPTSHPCGRPSTLMSNPPQFKSSTRTGS